MSRSTKKSAMAEAKNETNSAEVFAPGARHIPILALIWVGLVAATAVAALCPRFTAYYAAYIAICVALCAGALAFLDAIYRKRKAHLHPAFKKFLGYGLVLHYAACALPRVDWASSGLIGEGYVVYMFVLAMVCLAVGASLFVACGRPSAFAALGLITEAEAKDRALRKKRFAADRKKGFVRGALEWIDALGFAAVLVILVNTFVFQLYVIPSESMVPTFLMQDRPFTLKISAGPKIPLTDWRLPFLKLPARGDVVTLANPRYPENQGVNLKKYLSQLVSMVTFTAVTIDKQLPDGTPKSDPLVKRIVGLPGEQLMMVDDVLYARREGESSFSVVKEDEKWSHVDLWKESAELRSRIKTIPVNRLMREILSAWDARKNAADPESLASEIGRRASTIAASLRAAEAESLIAEIRKDAPAAYASIATARREFDAFSAGRANPIAAKGTRLDSTAALAIALSLPSSPAARAALADYAKAPAAAFEANAFDRGARALNLLIKKNAVDRIARYARLVSSGASVEAISKDADIQKLENDRAELSMYVGFFDARNFAPFPAGTAVLGPTQYFAMGDNRYNSIDFRNRDYSPRSRPIDRSDPGSVMYVSNIDPFALDLKFIEGYALFRIWPPSRAGSLK